MELVSLNSLIEAAELEGGGIHTYLSSFICAKNSNVEIYLREKAVDSEKRGFTRTVLIIDEKQNNEIIGYFTLMIRNFDFINVSGRTKQSLVGNKRATAFIAILIAQLGRSDHYKGKVNGSEILEFALERCSTINELSAIKIACVEYEDTPNLVGFYEDNDFKVLQKNDNGYIMSYVRL